MRPPTTKITSTTLSKIGAIIKGSPTEISLGSELFAGAFYQAFLGSSNTNSSQTTLPSRKRMPITKMFLQC